MADPANTTLGRMLMDHITPVVMVLSTPLVEQKCQKNGLSLVDLLSPFSIFDNIDGTFQSSAFLQLLAFSLVLRNLLSLYWFAILLLNFDCAGCFLDLNAVVSALLFCFILFDNVLDCRMCLIWMFWLCDWVIIFYLLQFGFCVNVENSGLWKY